MAFGDPGQSGGSGFSGSRRHHKPKRKRSSAPKFKPPQGDVQSSGGDYGIHEANKAKRSNKRVRRNTRFVYTQQKPEQRKRIARNTRNREDATGQLIQHEHQSRVARNREIEKGYYSHGDTKGDKDRARAARYLRVHNTILHPKRKQKASDIFLTDPKDLKAAGFKVDKADAAFQAPFRVPLTGLKAGQYTIETAVEDPKQIPKMAPDLGKSVLSIPAALIRSGLHPKQAVEEIAKDYSRRYGGIYENKPGAKKEFKTRQKKEGILPEVLDLAAVATAGGATAGRGLQKVAEAGALGKRAEKIAAAERPRLQTTGEAVAQDKSKNFIRNAARTATDTARQKHGQRKITKAEEHEGTVPVEVAEAARKTEQGTPTVAPVFRYTARKAQRKEVAKRKGRAITRQKVEQQATDTAAFHALHGVDENAFKYATQYGIRSSAQAKEVLPKLLDHIEKGRKEHGKAAPKRQDEVPAIKRLIDNPEAFDNPKLHTAVTEMSALSRKVAEQSPGFSAEDAAVRRAAPQAELLGVKREVAASSKDVATLKRQSRSAERAVLRARIPEAEARGKAGALVPQKDRAILRKQKDYVEAAKTYNAAAKELSNAQKAFGNAARYPDIRGGKGATKVPDAELKARTERLQKARAEVDEAKFVLDQTRAKIYRKGEIEAGKAARGEKHDRSLAALGRAPKSALRNLEKRRGRLMQAEQRAELLRKDVREAEATKTESASSFLKRAGEARGDLAEGEYFPSVKRLDGGFLNRTTGGSTAQADVKAYTGALTRTGRESANKHVFVNALHKEIRRKHNWNLVSLTFEHHTLPWSRDKSLSELQDEVDARNIDPNSVSYVNLRKVKLAQTLEDVGASSANIEEAFGTADPGIADLLNKAFVNPKDVSTHVEDFDKTGWAIVPREVESELKSGFKQSSAFGRLHRVTKGKISRVLLSNPVWLQFQIASNAMMAGAHHTGLISAIKAHYKFRQPEWKALQSDIGVHRFYDDQAKLGSAGPTNNQFLNGWRAWQKVGVGSKLAFAAHPVREFFNLFHRMDTAQNNLFRRAVFYNDVKREAYSRMAASSGRMVTAQKRIMSTFQLHDPERIMDSIIQDPHQFEKHAEAVNDFMGDWTTYTHKERAILGNALFGGFIRFSTRLAFYTMPMKHPVMASIVTQMGRLEKDELQQIFGTDVPPWEIGNYYSKDGKARFQALRLNPFANVFTSMWNEGVPQVAIGSVSPLIGILANQLAKGNVGFQQPWTVNGKQVQINGDIKNSDRLKIILGEVLKLSPYYRNLEKYGTPIGVGPRLTEPLRGKQNSSSSILFRNPREYDVENSKRPTQTQEAKDRNEAQKREEDKANPLAAITPVPSIGTDVIMKSRQYAASRKGGTKKKPTKGEFSLSGGGSDHKPGEFSLGGGGGGSHKKGEFALP